ncbi:MAG: adenylate/guanylate cyclase domain-containing protein [Candidatus Competibacter sp.]|nr:adenylate/guanylate cyclase domain-containing protein [Candidatus Competibacter sp.]MDG4584942.1 adenylate/guanylate cyclase domain-containing protein [Candidatus Competibacter sp.]
MNDQHHDWLLFATSALGIAMLAWLLVAQGPLRQAENWVGDLRIALMTPRQPPPDDLVLLTVTEDTLSQFPYRSPINRASLAEWIVTLNQKGVRAIGLDILFDRPTEPAADRMLAEALRNSTVPVVVAYADQEHLTQEQQEFLDAFTTGLPRGYVNLPVDNVDGVIRTLFPGRIAPDGRFTPGLAAALAGTALTTDADVLLRYRGLAPDAAADDLISAFKRYPIHLVTALPAAWLEGKTVLIGAELPMSGEDMLKTPFAVLLGDRQGRMPGVAIQAHALAQLREGRHLLVSSPWGALGLYLAAAALSILLTRLDWPAWVGLGSTLVLLSGCWALGFWWYRQGGALVPLAGPSLALLGTAWWSYAQAGRQERRQKRFIYGAFSRYLHPAWVKQLVADPDLLRLQGERREITVLFSDIAGFTAISEMLPPTTLVHLLSRYLEGMTQIILDHGGAVNKYLGDGIMVLFGAPVIQADHALRAVRCALALDAFAEAFRRAATDPDGRPVAFGQTRIGAHSGEVTVGNFGSTARLEYTAIGDAVNAASRLEGLNTYFGTRVAISGVTRAQIGDGKLWFRPMGRVVVKGKQQALSVFNPLLAGSEPDDLMEEYAEAYALLAAGNPQASHRFARLRFRYPNDPLVDFYWQRVQAGELTTRIKATSK